MLIVERNTSVGNVPRFSASQTAFSTQVSHYPPLYLMQWHLLLLVFALLLSPSNLNGFDEPTPLEETMTGSHTPCAIRGKSQGIGRMTPFGIILDAEAVIVRWSRSTPMTTFPESHRDLLKADVAMLATIGQDESKGGTRKSTRGSSLPVQSFERKICRKCFRWGSSNYPPYPMAVPLRGPSVRTTRRFLRTDGPRSQHRWNHRL